MCHQLFSWNVVSVIPRERWLENVLEKETQTLYHLHCKKLLQMLPVKVAVILQYYCESTETCCEPTVKFLNLQQLVTYYYRNHRELTLTFYSVGSTFCRIKASIGRFLSYNVSGKELFQSMIVCALPQFLVTCN